MAKSLRSKREKRLRAIRREIVEPFYEKKEAAKHDALQAALSAPKLPVRTSQGSFSMEITPSVSSSALTMNVGDVDMGENNESSGGSLKPLGKRMKKKLKIGKRNRGKGKIRRKNV